MAYYRITIPKDHRNITMGEYTIDERELELQPYDQFVKCAADAMVTRGLNPRYYGRIKNLLRVFIIEYINASYIRNGRKFGRYSKQAPLMSMARAGGNKSSGVYLDALHYHINAALGITSQVREGITFSVMKCVINQMVHIYSFGFNPLDHCLLVTVRYLQDQRLDTNRFVRRYLDMDELYYFIALMCYVNNSKDAAVKELYKHTTSDFIASVYKRDYITRRRYRYKQWHKYWLTVIRFYKYCCRYLDTY